MGKTELDKRISDLLYYSGLNAQRFAATIGCKTKQSIYDLLNGKTKTLTSGMQAKISTAFPEVNEYWLLTGEGPMLKQATQTQVVHGENNSAVQMGGTNNTYNAAPLPVVATDAVRPIVPAELYKKPNTDVYDEIVVKRTAHVEYAQFFSNFSDYDMYMRVQGDSMSSNFLRGDMLALSVMKATYILNGTIYVLDTKSYGLVLRVVIDRGEAYECHVIGDETRYAPFSVPKMDVIRIYQVMGLIRTCVS